MKILQILESEEFELDHVNDVSHPRMMHHAYKAQKERVAKLLDRGVGKVGDPTAGTGSQTINDDISYTWVPGHIVDQSHPHVRKLERSVAALQRMQKQLFNLTPETVPAEHHEHVIMMLDDLMSDISAAITKLYDTTSHREFVYDEGEYNTWDGLDQDDYASVGEDKFGTMYVHKYAFKKGSTKPEEMEWLYHDMAKAAKLHKTFLNAYMRKK